MIKYILILIAISGCSSHMDIIQKQYEGSLLSVNVGNSYVDMLRKVGHKPIEYTCDGDICTASYRVSYKNMIMKKFIFKDDVVVGIE